MNDDGGENGNASNWLKKGHYMTRGHTSSIGEDVMRRDERLQACARAMTLGASLSDIMADYPGAILAGGALRDTILGLPIKDFDLFIPVWNGTMPGETGELTSPEWKVRSEKYGSINSIFVRTVQHADQTFDLIYVYPDQTAEEDFAAWVLNKFDFGICKVSYDANGLDVHPHFWDDVSGKRLTLHTKSLGWESHYARLHEKFPDYAFVNAAEAVVPERMQTTHGFGLTA